MRVMRAVVIARPGGPDVLELRDRPVPEPGPGEIRVRVRATALNRADLLQRRGAYPVPAGAPADIPGLEYAGTVDARGPGAERWSAGDRVMGIVGGGSCAEYLTVHEDEALAMPAGMSFTDAAAIPEAFLTADDGFEQLGVRAGETVVIHAAPSGVGTAALQLAHARGVTVIGTSRSAWKLDRVAELGLTGQGDWHPVDASAEDWPERVLELTGGRGADAVLDLVGGGYLAGDVRCIARQGRILIVGLVAGATAELDMRTLLNRRAWIGGTVMRARSLREKIDVARGFTERALAGFVSGTLRPVVDVVLPLDDVAKAHVLMEENRNVGKIVLSVPAG
jgi:NADPH:quinone reductase